MVSHESTILILGTMPGEESLRQQQYYANKGNQFWKLLFAIFDEPFSLEYETRKALLVKNNIAVWDVLSHCERAGSLDSKIKNEVPNDFTQFHTAHPKITTVFFSSKNAAKYYDKYAGRLDHIQYHILPSPSGANAGKTFLQKFDEWKIVSESVS